MFNILLDIIQVLIGAFLLITSQSICSAIIVSLFLLYGIAVFIADINKNNKRIETTSETEALINKYKTQYGRK